MKSYKVTEQNMMKKLIKNLKNVELTNIIHHHQNYYYEYDFEVLAITSSNNQFNVVIELKQRLKYNYTQFEDKTVMLQVNKLNGIRARLLQEGKENYKIWYYCEFNDYLMVYDVTDIENDDYVTEWHWKTSKQKVKIEKDIIYLTEKNLIHKSSNNYQEYKENRLNDVLKKIDK